MKAHQFGLYAPWLDGDDYRQEADLARWQGKSIRHRLIDVTRRATKPSQRLLTFAAELDEERAGRDDVLETVLLRERVREVFAAVGRLSERQQVCLLADASGDTYAATAAREGLTAKQVDNAVAGARRNLRRAA